MALDNFNRQEIVDEIQELHNLTDKQAQNIEFSNVNEALENHEKMMKTFEINKTNFPDNNFQAVKNVFKNICEWKNFDEIEMTDIFKLSDMKKSQLAREVVAVKMPDFNLVLPSKDKSNPNIMINAKYFYDFFHNGSTLTEENLKKYINRKKLDLKTIVYNDSKESKKANEVGENMEKIDINKINLSNILGQMQNNIKEKSKDEYRKMFQWDVPPMYRVDTQAVWDLTWSKGIWQEENTGREYFRYNLNKKSQISSSLRFGSKEWPAEIWISANWIDGTKWWSVHILLGNKQIQLDYTNNWLNVVGNLPKWVQWKDWVLIIDQMYKDKTMTIETESKQYDNGGYDDLLFNFVCKNIGIWIATPMFDEGISKNFWLWEYKTDINEKNRILWCISTITDDISMCFAKNIPMNIWVSVDKNKFDESKISDFMKNTENVGLNSVMYNVTDQNEQAKIREKLTQAFNIITKQIESSNFEWDEIGKDAEKRLAKCRFWEVMDIALKDRNFRSQLASWTIKINPEFTIGEKWNRNVSVSCNEQDMILHVKNP